MKTQTFGRTLRGAIQMESKTLFIGLLVQLGAWALCLAVLAIVDLVIREEPPVMSIGLAGLFAVVAGVLVTYLEGVSQFNTNLAVEITFGISRRRSLVTAWVATLGCGVVTMVLAALQDGIWLYGLAGGAGEEIISLIPAWGWLCLAFLPGAAAVFTMGILRRFGKTGGLVLWLAFLVLCQTPQLLEITSQNMVEVLAAVMPVFLPMVGLALAVIGTLLLYCANAVITNR